MLTYKSVVVFAELPDKHGFAGMYCGMSVDALICAGGANFPNDPMAKGGAKVWSDIVYMLHAPNARWEEVGRLPKPSAYGVSASWRDAMVVVGGGDAVRNFRDCYLLRWDETRIAFEELPELPLPMSNCCGAVVGDTIYVAGGQETPNSATTLGCCYTLNLANRSCGWVEVPWPLNAPGRIQAVAGSHGEWFYFFSGIDLVPSKNGSSRRRYLIDAWRHNVEVGWERLPDLPHAVAAAPTPAMLDRDAKLVISGGVWPDYIDTISPMDAHPGFSRDFLVYDIGRHTWARSAATTLSPKTPPARVTTATAVWRGLYVIPSGEVAPGVRTRSVLGYRIG